MLIKLSYLLLTSQTIVTHNFRQDPGPNIALLMGFQITVEAINEQLSLIEVHEEFDSYYYEYEFNYVHGRYYHVMLLT